MSRWTTPAFVLRRWPYSETSLALHLLTPERGVVAALAKGVQRPTSGGWGVLDTWALVDIELGGKEGQAMLSLYSARLRNRYPGLATSPERLIAAGLAAELAELAAPPGSPSQAAFDYLGSQLRAIEAGTDAGLATVTALLHGLDLLGVGPLLAGGSMGWNWFSPAHGGLLPAGAVPPATEARRVRASTMAWLTALRSGRPAAQPTRTQLDEALTILGEFAAYHLERPPRAWQFLRARRRRARLR